MKVLGISASPNARSRSAALLRLATGQLAARGAVTEEIMVRELPPQALLWAQSEHPAIVAALARVARADVVLVATPIYKAAYSGLLKVFLDLWTPNALLGKTVLALATGGSPSHLLALDYALKPVLSALGARHQLDAVYATDSQLHDSPSGGFVAEPEVEDRLRRSLSVLDRSFAAVVPVTPRGRGPAAVPVHC